ncbi:Alanine--tRNA ligase [Candidatus Trichorickettsia mobilis]|uniref:Alanine--tRNA ligase n=1 Tax=Candidatus Trichorickettsia mobilis TaxID=1346319 RepID=A0ABZ0UUP1_9RICK|nr:alanine--tRNA ligase [Candidatus Trichorickettsia mobilis]WPY01378.1 Alanine--tRNA ligase [Candidatus Trichorickettsia mobilis]
MFKPTTAEIRKLFLDYFIKNNHTHVAASPLIPHNDPSLMFVNSGMVQFKNVFTGQENRSYTRATSSQKSVRAGGKHNDLDNVGYTARHHTFFEMLGNFSFGDYFKEEAIYYAWQLLTKEFGLKKDKLYVTIYHTDDEAAHYWQKISGFNDDRIIRINTTDNFWSMGDTGPCGPCSEIFYDHGEHIKGGLPGTAEADGDRYIEIWNMVFMQFEQIDQNTRIELPKKSIDTGMGLERIAAVLQNVHDNYDIDLFQEIIESIEQLVSVKAHGDDRFSFRVIADHLRSCAFLIADGVMPSNEGRGYVLRRIMRRSMRHAHLLGAIDPLIYKLLPKLISLMGEAYPELKRAENFISDILYEEEIRFKATLERGLKLLDDETLSINTGGTLSGEVAFKLYDTYGFPLDLTEDILKKKAIAVDLAGFNNKMQEQKQRARAAWSGSGEDKIDNIWFDLKSEFGSTEFLGYAFDNASAKIIALLQENILLDSINESNQKFILLTNQTPFYAESGGQLGDIGLIESATAKVKVLNTVKYLGSIHAHICVLEEGKINIGDIVKLSIDKIYRKNLRAHHSATHILHAVLHELIGKHVTQKGSLVAHNRLRFDISHPKALTQEQIEQIEDRVNEIIIENSTVNTVLMSTDQAINAGAMALFGEKYDDEVRVVSMGGNINHEGRAYSLELCGGLHVARTGDIGAFKIVAESAIAAGVRRIEAVCGKFALELARQNEHTINLISSQLKTPKTELIAKINALNLVHKQLEQELLEFKISALDLTQEEITAQTTLVKDIRLIYRLVQNVDAKLIRLALERIIVKGENLVVVYISSNTDDKIAITVAISKELSTKLHAGNIAKEISIFLGGNGGGGQAGIAQAGGIDTSKLPVLKEKIVEILKIL